MARTSIRYLVLCAVDALVLSTLQPSPHTLWHELSAPHAWVARAGADAAAGQLVGAVLWLVALWLAIGLAAAAVSHVPGAIGDWARRLARVTLPRALQRTAVGAAGLGVLLAPVAASAHTVAHAPARTATSAAPSAAPFTSTVPAPTWPYSPMTPGERTPQPVSTASKVPAPVLPRSDETPPIAAEHSAGPIPHRPPTHPVQPPAAQASASSPPTRSPAPSPTLTPHAAPSTPGHGTSAPSTPGHGTPGHHAQRPPALAPADSVTVHHGDSLWKIAAAHLPHGASDARIAESWPNWWAANRHAIGSDPNYLTPGQVLHAPPKTETP